VASRGRIHDGSQLPALGGFQFGEPSLSRGIRRDVGIRSVCASSQKLQLVRFLELDRPPRGILVLVVRVGRNIAKGMPRNEDTVAKTRIHLASHIVSPPCTRDCRSFLLTPPWLP
jgi:hypothetical protein